MPMSAGPPPGLWVKASRTPRRRAPANRQTSRPFPATRPPRRPARSPCPRKAARRRARWPCGPPAAPTRPSTRQRTPPDRPRRGSCASLPAGGSRPRTGPRRPFRRGATATASRPQSPPHVPRDAADAEDRPAQPVVPAPLLGPARTQAPLSAAALVPRRSAPLEPTVVHVTIDRLDVRVPAAPQRQAETPRGGRSPASRCLTIWAAAAPPVGTGAGHELAARHRRGQRGAAQPARRRPDRGRRGDGQHGDGQRRGARHDRPRRRRRAAAAERLPAPGHAERGLEQCRPAIAQRRHRRAAEQRPAGARPALPADRLWPRRLPGRGPARLCHAPAARAPRARPCRHPARPRPEPAGRQHAATRLSGADGVRPRRPGRDDQDHAGPDERRRHVQAVGGHPDALPPLVRLSGLGRPDRGHAAGGLGPAGAVARPARPGHAPRARRRRQPRPAAAAADPLPRRAPGRSGRRAARRAGDRHGRSPGGRRPCRPADAPAVRRAGRDRAELRRRRRRRADDRLAGRCRRPDGPCRRPAGRRAALCPRRRGGRARDQCRAPDPRARSGRRRRCRPWPAGRQRDARRCPVPRHGDAARAPAGAARAAGRPRPRRPRGDRAAARRRRRSAGLRVPGQRRRRPAMAAAAGRRGGQPAARPRRPGARVFDPSQQVTVPA